MYSMNSAASRKFDITSNRFMLYHPSPRAMPNDKLPHRSRDAVNRYGSSSLGIAQDERWYNIDHNQERVNNNSTSPVQQQSADGYESQPEIASVT